MSDDDPGCFTELLGGDGFSIDIAHLYDGQAIPDLAGYDLLMVLGGAMDVWQVDEYPWLIAEQEAIFEWAGKRARPFIGICLGHQLLASALGGTVGPAAHSEVGQHSITIAGDVEHAFIAGLADEHPVMQWHHAEVTDPPEGAKVLASSDAAAIQMLAVGEHALGVQFHFEWTLEVIRNWPQSWLDALRRKLGEGAHARVIADAEKHMPGIVEMRRTIYENFKRANGL